MRSGSDSHYPTTWKDCQQLAHFLAEARRAVRKSDSGLGASFIVLNNALRIGEGAGSLAFLDSQTFAIEPERMWELSHRPAKTLPLLPMVLSALRQS
jgi:hypothetical protein